MRRAFARVGTYGLAVGPALILGEMLILALRVHSVAIDAATSYLPAAREILDGSSPYDPAQVARGIAFASPPIGAVLFTPFVVLPHVAAQFATSTAMLAAVLAALRLVGVRDWRCYAVAAMSAPLVGEFQTANLSGLIALSAALVWRYRDHPLAAGAAAGAPVALKLFFWPVIVFLLATRRFKTAAWSAACTIVFTLLPWAAIGFAGMRAYPHLLGLLARSERSDGYSLGALIAPMSSWAVADAVTYAFVTVLLLLALRARDEGQRYIFCTAAALASTPVVWMHYFVLLFVVVGIAAPGLEPIWFVPLALWISAREGPLHAWQTIFVLAVVTATFVAAYRTLARRASVPQSLVRVAVD